MRDDATYVVDTITALRAEIARLTMLHDNAKHWEAQWLAEIARLRSVLADIKCGAVNITMAKQMAERALEPKP